MVWLSPKRQQVFTYDEDGNLLNDGLWDYVYNAENHLVRVTSVLDVGFGASLGHVRKRVDFKYDYRGRRIAKTVDNLDTPGETIERRFVYDGWNLIAELNGTGAVIQRTYAWGLDLTGDLTKAGGIGALLQMTNYNSGNPGTSYYPTYDGNGNVASLVNATSGDLAAVYEYDAFGNNLRTEVMDAAVADNPFRFSTKYTDVETGLVYYGLRYYSPTLGRFINRDPIEERGGRNLYAFSTNNPINKWDYLGMITVPDWFDGTVDEFIAWNNISYANFTPGTTDGSMNDMMMDGFSGDLAGNMDRRHFGFTGGSSFSDIYTLRVNSVTLTDGTVVRLPAGSTLQDFEPGGNFSNGLNLTANNSGGYTASAAKDPLDVRGTFAVHLDPRLSD